MVPTNCPLSLRLDMSMGEWLTQPARYGQNYDSEVSRLSPLLPPAASISCWVGKYDGAVLRKRLKEGAGQPRVHDTGRVRVRVLTVTSNGEKATAGRRIVLVLGAIKTPRKFPGPEETE